MIAAAVACAFAMIVSAVACALTGCREAGEVGEDAGEVPGELPQAAIAKAITPNKTTRLIVPLPIPPYTEPPDRWCKLYICRDGFKPALGRPVSPSGGCRSP